MSNEPGNINMPLISICMPAYNCGPFIQQTLACLCAQSYSNIEIIVVNDGSTDDTRAQIESITDQRITLINLTNGGAAKARNIAYQHSKGKYIIFFDADDHVKPDFILQQVKKINDLDDVVVLADWGRFYGDDFNSFVKEANTYDELFFEDWINDHWHNNDPMTTPGRVIIPKKIVEQAGPWNESLNLNDDLEFYSRVFLKAKKILFNHNATFYYRSGIKGLSSKKGSNAYLSLYKSIQLSTELILAHFGDNAHIKQSCANLWQGFVHEVYPYENELTRKAEQNIKALGGANLPFLAGGYTKTLATLIGWKLTKKLKNSFKN
ncbi:glycosyltransferase family 2 protein [Mucilaginibacter sp.]|uniref:glycosyltransferase family 2 protein n=1 Tax=Mucilaginibacter sp. TaxID=1882438 RepID=UPI003D0AA000